jgi:hypothetical protein
MGREYIRDLFSLLQLNLLLNGKHLFYNICLSCNFFNFRWSNIHTAKNHFLINKKILNLRNYFLKWETDFLNKKNDS